MERAHFTQYFEDSSSILTSNAVQLLMKRAVNSDTVNRPNLPASVGESNCDFGLNWFWSEVNKRLFNSDQMASLTTVFNEAISAPCSSLFATCNTQVAASTTSSAACLQTGLYNTSAGSLDSDWLKNVDKKTSISQEDVFQSQTFTSFSSVLYSILFGTAYSSNTNSNSSVIINASTLSHAENSDISSQSNLIPPSNFNGKSIALHSQNSQLSNFTLDHASLTTTTQPVLVGNGLLSKLHDSLSSTLESNSFQSSHVQDDYFAGLCKNSAALDEASTAKFDAYLISRDPNLNPPLSSFNWSCFTPPLSSETITDQLTCQSSTIYHTASKDAAQVCSSILTSVELATRHLLFDQSSLSFNFLSNTTESTLSDHSMQNSSMFSNASHDSIDVGFEDLMTWAFWFWVLVGFLMVVMSLMTTFGNMLVIVSFIYDSKLRTVSNFYILNLAIADFFIGSVCIPLYIPSILWQEWRLGRTLCKMFLVIDNIMCTGSVLNIMLISSDRYLSVIHAMTYRVDQTIKKAVMKMLAVWTVAFTIYGPSTLFWEYFVGERIVLPHECLPEFYRNFPYTFSIAVVEFITPLVTVCYINLKIYLNIKSRSKKMKQNSLCADEIQGAAAAILKEKEARNLKRDKKAARALAIIVGAFFISWAPYTVCNLIRTLWPFLITDTLMEITFWLLWLNSMINPFLYPYCHPNFRQTFEVIVGKLGCLFCKRYRNRDQQSQRGHMMPMAPRRPTAS